MDSVNEVKGKLNEEFDIKDLGEWEYFFSIQIICDRTTRQIYISQIGYIDTVLQWFKMLNCKPVTTPIVTTIKVFKSIEGDNMVK